MESMYKCPQCHNPIPMDRLVGQSVVCQCGWSGTKKQLEAKPKNPWIKRGLLGLVLVALCYLVYDGLAWGSHYPKKLIHSISSTLHLTTPHQEAKFAAVAIKVGKAELAAKLLAKAYKRDPNNFTIGRFYAKTLVRIKKFESAVLAYQRIIAEGKDKPEDHRWYALALSGDNTEGAKEAFYKAIKSDPTNFDAAKDLILYLMKEQNYIEALSVLGHYNTNYPKTIEGWNTLALKLKKDYVAFNSEFRLDEMKISGLTQFLFAPVQFESSGQPTVFLVDNSANKSQVDLRFLQSRGIAFKDMGAVELPTKNGSATEQRKVLIDQIEIGPFTVNDFEAVACERCAFLLGKKVLKRMNYQEEVVEGVRFATLSK